MCTPTYALRLFEVALEERLEDALESIERVICTGEPGASLPAVRSRIEEAFGARCLDHAGLTEVGPYGYPCAEHGGMHVYDDEFVERDARREQRPVAAGERGELVLTPLRPHGLPGAALPNRRRGRELRRRAAPRATRTAGCRAASSGAPTTWS